MVNAKNVAFKVNKQTPISEAPAQAYGTVINCRKPGGKRSAREQKEVRSHYVTLANIDGTLKRKWDEDWDIGPDGATTIAWLPEDNATSTLTIAPDRLLHVQRWHPPKPPRSRKLKGPSNGVDMDCWFIILSFSDPAQLLLMRTKISSCFRFLSLNPMLWKHSRNYHYGSDLPEPPSELTEFQYADLRHEHGCMSCKAPNTRKTYWAFLRRWCKTCLQSKTLREHDATDVFREVIGPTDEDVSFLLKCLPSGIFDSWGNFVGVGPATTHALKTVYLFSDVKKIAEAYVALKKKDVQPLASADEFNAWLKPKMELVEERKTFAHKMESWEEMIRGNRTCDYSAKKSARKTFFQQKAAELEPPITAREIECCPSYKRAIVIPKDPNNTSWQQLRPKLEKEAAELREKGGPPEDRSHTSSLSGTSTPNSVIEPHQSYVLPSRAGLALHNSGFPIYRHTYPGTGSAPNHNQLTSLPPLSHMHSGPSGRPNQVLPPPHNHTYAALPPTQNYGLGGPHSTQSYALGGPSQTLDYGLGGPPLPMNPHAAAAQHHANHRPAHSHLPHHPVLPPPHSRMF